MSRRALMIDAATARRLADGAQRTLRRPANSRPEDEWRVARYRATPDNRAVAVLVAPARDGLAAGETELTCQYGGVGDTLWCREPWGVDADGRTPLYRADHPDAPGPWFPAAKMPLWAGRLYLRITAITLTRRAATTPVEARAEGFASVAALRAWWDGRHAARGRGWDADPWCWLIAVHRTIIDRAALDAEEAALWDSLDPPARAKFRRLKEIAALRGE